MRRRISRIDNRVILFRIEDGGLEQPLSRHAWINDGDIIKARSSTISYGHLGYSVENVVDGKSTHHKRLALDIADYTSRERIDIWVNGNPDFVSGKSREDYERHNVQKIAERDRGVKAKCKIEFDCIIGAVEKGREYEMGGFSNTQDAFLIANRRQFYRDGRDYTPFPRETVELEGDKFLAYMVSKESAVVRMRLTSDDAAANRK